MILNLKVTMAPAPGREPEQVADVNIVVMEVPQPMNASRYILECKDAAGSALARAVADGLAVKHVLDVNEEPDY